jgi:hypothetical protein
MKNIYLILGIFIMLFSACETDFDVNAEWEETTVIFGLLDASDQNQLQKIKISKAFLGNMDAYQMAQYSDSINYGVDELDVKIYKWNYNQIEDSVELIPMPTYRDGEIFYDSIIVYQFYNLNSFLQKGYEYELVVKNNMTGTLVSSRTEIVTGFDFDNIFITKSKSFQFGLYTNNDFSSSTITWDDSNDNGTIYQLDLIFHYTEIMDGVYTEDSLIYSLPLIDDTESKMKIEGNSFFNFLALNLDKNQSIIRYFNDIDMIMTVGSEDLETYINVNKPITGIVQERPQFTNINNGIGLFSSRFKKNRFAYDLTSSTLDYLKSVDGLDRNFQ